MKVDEQIKVNFSRFGPESVNLGQILVLARTARSEEMTMRFHSLDRVTAESPHARRDLPPVGRSFDDALSVSAAATICSTLNLLFVVALLIITLSSVPKKSTTCGRAR